MDAETRRKAAALLDQNPNPPVGRTSARYIHEYLRTSTIAESKGGFGMGTAQEKASPYFADRVEAHLNERAEEGWRLVSMEPHWRYERQVISGATRPLAIVGWYLTFERRE